MIADRDDPLDPRPRRVEAVPLSVVADALGAVVDESAARVLVTGVTLGSKDVRPGDLYAALPGATTHGARFVPQALAAGACAVLTDETGASDLTEVGVPVLVVDDPRARLGEVSALVYSDPSSAIVSIGITGTQGKTTSTYLAESALRASHERPAVIGTIGTRIDGRPVSSELTTPEAPQLHALFAVMVEQGVSACAMEVSSHALVKGRVDGVLFDVAVFLNLGRDHLDFHDGLEDYFDAKALLFTPEHAQLAVVNIDDEHGRRLVERTALPVLTFSATGADADWQAVGVRADPLGSTVLVSGPDGQGVELRVPLPGFFNVTNALAVTAALAGIGLELSAIASGIAACPGVPGRMETVDVGQDFAAIVDYAHKPDALSAVLTALRPLTTGRLMVVVGAGGDRDRGKRPLMGAIAAELADVVVVTDDNPRTEDAAAIRAEVLAGARTAGSHDADLHEIGDRRSAIERAVALARPGDAVLVAGKGHETGQYVGGAVHPFDDREVLREVLIESVR